MAKAHETFQGQLRKEAERMAELGYVELAHQLRQGAVTVGNLAGVLQAATTVKAFPSQEKPKRQSRRRKKS